MSSEFRAPPLPPGVALGFSYEQLLPPGVPSGSDLETGPKAASPSPLSPPTRGQVPRLRRRWLGLFAERSLWWSPGPGGIRRCRREALAWPSPGLPAASDSGHRPLLAYPSLGRGPASPPRTPPLWPALRRVILLFSPAAV